MNAPGTPAEEPGTPRTPDPLDPLNPLDPPGTEPGTSGDLDGETPEEAALRDLLRDAVRDVRPAPDALDHLRRAVPARRQHRRQAMAGSVAALLLAGAAVPALIHATDAGGATAASPAGLAGTHTSQPGEDGRVNTWSTTGAPGRDGQGRDRDGAGQRSPSDGVRNPTAQATSPGARAPMDAPACSGGQLGAGVSKAGSPDAQGRVYGWFRVANVSTSTCTMPADSGTVSVHPLSAAPDPAQISVVSHTADDPAKRLPATPQAAPVVLAPGQSYEVAYAWVPAGAGPGGCPQPTSPPATGTPTPTPTDTTAASGGDSQTDTTDSAPSDSSPGNPPSGPSSGTPQPGDFTLLHSSTADGPVVSSPTVQDACAGTVYTTAPMAETPDVTTP